MIVGNSSLLNSVPSGPALGDAGPNWEQFQSAQSTCTKVCTCMYLTADYTLAGPPWRGAQLGAIGSIGLRSALRTFSLSQQVISSGLGNNRTNYRVCSHFLQNTYTYKPGHNGVNEIILYIEWLNFHSLRPRLIRMVAPFLVLLTCSGIPLTRVCL